MDEELNKLIIRLNELKESMINNEHNIKNWNEYIEHTDDINALNRVIWLLSR